MGEEALGSLTGQQTVAGTTACTKNLNMINAEQSSLKEQDLSHLNKKILTNSPVSNSP